MADDAFFEHIAIAVPPDDLRAWDAALRSDLGGTAALGGAEAGAGFQGGQITYPDGGMLELLSVNRGRNEQAWR